MDWQTLQKQLSNSLSIVYKDNAEAETISDIYIENLSQLSRLDRRFTKQLPTSLQITQYNKDKIKLENQYPIQYLIHKAWFGKYEFYVDECVLIPRPETEELVDLIIQQNKNRSNLKILDIGTGSGCIAISLALANTNWEVAAVDISNEALQVAAKNASKWNANVTFKQLDILNETILGKYDLIVSNPPYIMLEEQVDMKENVLNYEPHKALFVTDNDPLQFYKAIEEIANTNLKEDGKIYLELNQRFGAETQNYYNSKKWQTNLIKDIYHNDRLLFCSR